MEWRKEYCACQADSRACQADSRACRWSECAAVYDVDLPMRIQCATCYHLCRTMILESTESGRKLSYVHPQQSWVTSGKLFLPINGDRVIEV
jgi:hypothetical protein